MRKSAGGIAVMKRIAGASMLVVASSAAEAAGGLVLIDAPPKESYTFAAGPAVLGFPESPGSSRTRVWAIPGIDFYASNGAFASTDIGLGWNFSHREDVQAGVRLWPVLGRDDERSRQRGLKDIGNRLGKGLFLNYAPWEFLILQSSVLAGSGAHGDGVQAEVGATVGAPVGSTTLVGLTLGTTWANGPYQRTYYGVTPAESAAGGLPVWIPGGGWLDLNLGLTGETKINRLWRLSGQVIAARLLGDAKRSPVVGSPTSVTFSLTLWYQFK